jgi:hypothetical protein
VLTSTSHLGRFEHPEYHKSFLNNTANVFKGGVFLIKVVYDTVMCIKYALFQRNNIVFIHVVLGQTKMASRDNRLGFASASHEITGLVLLQPVAR